MIISKSGLTSIILLILLSICARRIEAQKNLYPGSSWNYIDYQFDNTFDRSAVLNSRKFIIGNPFPIDVDAYYGANGIKQFITTPRFLDGTPITLGTITGATGSDAPLIAPYPRYSWHNTTDCSGLTSVFRVAVDECNRLWVLDTGKIGERQVCPPQIVVFDAETDICLSIYKFPSFLVREASLFINLVVDVRTCTDTMVYIADVNAFAIVVYNYKNNSAWRVQNKLFYPTPSNGTFTIAGESFDLMDGVFGMSVSPKNFVNRQLYFHSLASTSENSIYLSVLDNNEALWTATPDASPRSFVEIGIRDNSQSTVEAMDNYGNQYFGTLRPLGIGCWDTSKPYNRDNLKLVIQNDVTLQFISGLKIRTNRQGIQELWVLSCRFQKIISGTRKLTEVNYRIQGIKTTELLGGSTKCNGLAFPRV